MCSRGMRSALVRGLPELYSTSAYCETTPSAVGLGLITTLFGLTSSDLATDKAHPASAPDSVPWSKLAPCSFSGIVKIDEGSFVFALLHSSVGVPGTAICLNMFEGFMDRKLTLIVSYP